MCLGLRIPIAARRPVEHGICFLAPRPGELFGLRIPFKLRLQTDGDVAQVTDRGAAVPELHRRVGSFRDLTAIQEVSDMVFAGMILFDVEYRLGLELIGHDDKVLAHVFDANDAIGAFEHAADIRVRRSCIRRTVPLAYLARNRTYVAALNRLPLGRKSA